MPFYVRAALALSLPVGLIALSAGGAIVGWHPADRMAPSVASPHLVADRLAESARAEAQDPSPPPTKPALTEQVAETPTARAPDVATEQAAPQAATITARDAYQPPDWLRQYAAMQNDAPLVGLLADRAGAAANSAALGQASPIQYLAMDPPANAPPATTEAAPVAPAIAAAAPTALPQAVEPATTERPPVPLDLAALAPVSQQAQLRVDEAFRYARRGALYAARAELIQSLRMMAQAVDTLERDNRRSQALAAGFHAMKEAEDFFVSSDTLEQDLDVEGVVLAHRTSVLKGKRLDGVSSLAALQQYYAYAQQQFSIAAAGTPAGSRALYGLGKVHMTLARESSDDRSHQTPKAMAFFQAAMQADQRNYLAANELGVLLAQYGQLAEARRVLVHSVSMHSHVEGWQNLSVVHARLGENDLAHKANHERELLIARSAGKPSGDQPVTWVGPQEFNAVGGPDAMATAPAYRPGNSSPTTRR